MKALVICTPRELIDTEIIELHPFPGLPF